MHANYFRIGGVHQDLPPKFLDDIWAFCDPFLKVCDDIEGLLTENRIFKQRNVSIAVVKLADAWGWGFSGVMVRGSGATWGLRKAQPYECYSELDFDIPIGKNGDNYDRYCIRMEEMRQSVRIMKQCLEKLRLPEGRGPVAVRDNKIVPPLRAEMKRSMEATIHHFKLYSEGHHVPVGEVYAAVEAPKGEFGVYLVAEGTNRPYKCKIRAPSFAHLQAMDFLSRGHMLADVAAIIGSLDRFSKHQEDQGIARERFHHGEQNRPHGRSAGSDFNRNSAVTLRDADGLVATGGVSKRTSRRNSSATVGPHSAMVRMGILEFPYPAANPADC